MRAHNNSVSPQNERLHPLPPRAPESAGSPCNKSPRKQEGGLSLSGPPGVPRAAQAAADHQRGDGAGPRHTRAVFKQIDGGIWGIRILHVFFFFSSFFDVEITMLLSGTSCYCQKCTRRAGRSLCANTEGRGAPRPPDRSLSVPLCRGVPMPQTLAGNCLRGVTGYNADDFDLLSLSLKRQRL